MVKQLFQKVDHLFEQLTTFFSLLSNVLIKTLRL